MHPILFKIGPFAVYSYGMMLAIAMLVSTFLIIIKARGQGLKKEIIISLSFYTIISAIIGARIFYVVLNLKQFFDNPLEIIMVQHGGLVFYGGLFGGLFGGIIYIKRNKLDVLQVLDVIAPYIALGQAISRIGCLLNGCCYGRPVSTGAGLIFPVDSIAGNLFPKVALHPTQFYSGIANIVIFLVLLKWSNFEKKNGEIFAGYLLLYSIKRFLVEFLRGDSLELLFGLTFFQIASIVTGVIALFWVLIPKESIRRIR